MSEAKKGDTVKIHYTGTLTDGTQFDSSEGQEPLEFKLGEGLVIPGFESNVAGMTVGEKKSIHIPVDEAYGQRNDEMMEVVERQHFPDDMKLEVGMHLQTETFDGSPYMVVVAELSDESVTVDGNHPLAGQALNFDIELVSIT
ncbi:MAG: peptidylprolyl isomerase [Candidatus Polarisedimenticolaceae bacterium]|nr:peptidylprolyl isomerase [Candidatus Polarisedimenticolaceae bacterium]